MLIFDISEQTTKSQAVSLSALSFISYFAYFIKYHMPIRGRAAQSDFQSGIDKQKIS